MIFIAAAPSEFTEPPETKTTTTTKTAAPSEFTKPPETTTKTTAKTTTKTKIKSKTTDKEEQTQNVSNNVVPKTAWWICTFILILQKI